MHTSGDFKLHGGDSAFANRQKLLFDKLSDAEQECNKNKMTTESTDVDMAIDESNKSKSIRTGLQRKNETKRFRGKESIFKRPEGPAPRAVNRSVPDYHKHPHKWMKYSLDDVSNDDMTEQSNTTAALSFLNELKARRSMEQIEGTEEMDYDEISMIEHDQTKVACKSKKVKARKSLEAEDMDVDNTTLDEHERTKTVIKPRKIKATSEIEFKKPESDTEKTENAPIIIDHDDKPTFRSSKVIMPEYIVGQKQKKKKNKKEKPVEKVDRLKQLKLDHLEELDEEEN